MRTFDNKRIPIYLSPLCAWELGRSAFLFLNNRANLRSLQSDKGRDRKPNHKENEDRESDNEDPNDVPSLPTLDKGVILKKGCAIRGRAREQQQHGAGHVWMNKRHQD